MNPPTISTLTRVFDALSRHRHTGDRARLGPQQPLLDLSSKVVAFSCRRATARHATALPRKRLSSRIARSIDAVILRATINVPPELIAKAKAVLEVPAGGPGAEPAR
jgi:hypothetical protein